MAVLRIGVLTCSDTRTEENDTSGAALRALSEERGWETAAYAIVPDDADAISSALVRMADEDRCDVVLTTGGTGLSPRDQCPEATLAIADREVPGIAEAIRSMSLAITRRAMLSRAVAAQRGRTLIVNLPGSEKGARESFGIVADQLEHAVEMIAGGGHG
ncbi:MAG: MogA/MoaB family molybdenum cofactor biosynthesis protein [Coriobacteriia bacterium]|nr:MogA/MoaB family molybdenum cofactor biosynthesis protein [Coriobacteriia bacterium]